MIRANPLTMIFDYSDYRDILQWELKKRCDVNASYSLRAFAGKLKIPVSTLSEVLNHKSGLSLNKAKLISSLLNHNKFEQEYFVNLVESVHARSQRHRELAKIRLLKFKQTAEKNVDLDTWKFIAEWYHAGILELSKVEDFRSEPRWIAQKLGITSKEARLACERLVRLGILRFENKKLVPTGRWLLTSPNDIPAESIKQFHLNLLKKALSAIYEQSVDERNYSSLIMAIEKDKLPEAKKLIGDFNRKLSQLMTNAPERKSLYCFGTQLFRIGSDLE